MKPTIQELITLYNNTESRIERANLWSHIEEKIEEISYDLLKDHSKYTSKYKNLLIAKFKFNELKISSKFSLINCFSII
mgnify:CR=1 FL=1